MMLMMMFSAKINEFLFILKKKIGVNSEHSNDDFLWLNTMRQHRSKICHMKIRKILNYLKEMKKKWEKTTRRQESARDIFIMKNRVRLRANAS